jgi:hypothetical protein
MLMNIQYTTNKGLILLANGNFVDTIFLDLIRETVNNRLPSLVCGKTYTMRKICEDLWEKLDEGGQRRAGWCMLHLALKHQVPFVHVGKNRSNSNVYQLC